MSLVTSTAESPAAAGTHALKRSLPSLYLQLTKARLSAMAVLTTAVGFVMGSTQAIDWPKMWWTIAGTALAAGAANALNQLAEIRRDGLMRRTHDRPLPSGAMGAMHAFVLAMVMACTGLAILGLLVNLAAAALALLTILIYILLYTPLKTRTIFNTLVGAVCGAIPPLIGWVAAGQRLDGGAWILAALLFVWQIPHFFALAWLYRDDYLRGGFRMLPAIDRSGRLTGLVVLLGSLALLPLGLAATVWGLTGWVYAVGSILLGACVLGLGARLCARRTQANARAVFLASIIYLPILLCLMVVDRSPSPGDAPESSASAGVADLPMSVAAREHSGLPGK